MNNIMKITLADNIKKYRKHMNMTQRQLANKFNISTVAVCKWETGESFPDITLLPKIAYLFKICLIVNDMRPKR